MAAKIAALIIRDPDGSDEIRLFLDGVELDLYNDPDVDVFLVDAGMGYTADDWNEGARTDVARAGQHGDAVRAAVEEAYADPPGVEYIDL